MAAALRAPPPACLLAGSFIRDAQVHGLEEIPAPSTVTAKALLAPPAGAVFEDVPRGTALRGGRELSRQEQLLSDRRLSLKAKLDLQARLAAANLGSLLFVHGPQADASNGAPSARPATARFGAATARQSSPPNPGPSVARPLTARLSTPHRALDVVARRRPATARPAAHRPAAEASVTARRHAPTPTLRVWAVQDAPAEHAEQRQEGPEQEVQDVPASESGPVHTAREGQAPADGDEKAPAQMLLKCNYRFKSQPDPRWKDRFRETALELQKAADLERSYAERMSSYGGKQISRARVQLNTPRDEPERPRTRW